MPGSVKQSFNFQVGQVKSCPSKQNLSLPSMQTLQQCPGIRLGIWPLAIKITFVLILTVNCCGSPGEGYNDFCDT